MAKKEEKNIKDKTSFMKKFKAGFVYTGDRFTYYFSDFEKKYGQEHIRDSGRAFALGKLAAAHKALKDSA